MDELFIYDRDKGLFKEILKHSTVIGGRYHLSANYGYDLNTNNLEQYLKDPASGLADAGQKYPACICITPKSRIVSINGNKWEEFYFYLYFVCTTNYTGQNKIKSLDPSTNTSSHHVWYDWKDMKECAVNFLELLKKVQKKPVDSNGNTVPLGSIFNVDTERADIVRLTKMNNDKISGVGLYFSAFMLADTCNLQDYTPESLDSITIPPLSIHPLHKH